MFCAECSARLPITDGTDNANPGTSQSLPILGHNSTQSQSQTTNQEPIVEMPPSPEIHAFVTSPELGNETPDSPQSHMYMPTSVQPYTEFLTTSQSYVEIHSPEEHCPEVLEPRESMENVPESNNPTVDLPRTPESEHGGGIQDIEDLYTDAQEIPTIELNDEEFFASVSKYIDEKKFQNSGEISNAIVVSAQSARIPARKLKSIKDLRTEHLV